MGDKNEARAIAEVFEGHRPYVASTKSLTGHEMWMAGASETILLDPDDEQRLHRPEPQLRATRRGLGTAEHPHATGRHDIRHLPVELLRVRRHELDPDRQRSSNPKKIRYVFHLPYIYPNNR